MKFVDAHTAVKLFTELKVDLIKYHGSFADDLGFNDEVVKGYTEEDALFSMNQRNVYSYILYDDCSNIMGILDFEKTFIATDNTSSVYIKDLYFKEEYRKNGYIKEVIDWLKVNYVPNYIECECYYNLPSNDIVQHIGFKRLFTRYALKV